MERRLAAILAADVVGYSRLIRADEEATITALKALRADLIDPKIAAHHGRIVKLMGDGMLAEFSSVVDAVRAAVETQQAVAEHNSGRPKDKRIEFRVGINLGDVVIDGDDIHGDGVNVAARLEGLAEPGGIRISGAVYDQVRDRTDFAFEDLGEQEVKNINRPVRVWRWLHDGALTTGDTVATDRPLPLPDKPCIAVLPFNNMSGDPEQEYFADGITEDIITGLSRFREFLIIARNSTFVFKGAAVDIKTVARELSARYVVEGSVRKAGNRIRITAQLIDAQSGAHLWAERYDRDLTDIFAVQDEVTESIISAIAPRSVEAELRRTTSLTETELGSWDLLLQARFLLGQREKKSNAQARKLLDKAIELDPGNAQAFSSLAATLYTGSVLGWVDDIQSARRTAKSAALKAVSLDPDDALAHACLGHSYAFFDSEADFESAIAEAHLALRLNPNLAAGHGILCGILALTGDLEAARKHLETAVRLSPRDPAEISLRLIRYNVGAFGAGEYEEVIRNATQAIRSNPDYPAPYRQRAASLAMLGRLDEARRDIDRLLALEPGVTIKHVQEQLSSFFPNLDRFLQGLRMAGLPEE